MMPFVDGPSESRAPRRALAHPLWLVALVVLVFNDHLLKGAWLIPPWLTGKLSDFAGLLVAPLLVAAVANLRSRAGWWASHVVVGTIFSAIQLSPTAAEHWASLMAAVGFPWRIVCDPTDLVALVVLPWSAVVFERAMTRPALRQLRRTTEMALIGGASLACLATSRPSEPQDPSIWSDAFIHNGTEETLWVRVRGVAPSVELSCEALRSNPGVLAPEMFEPFQTWVLEPDDNMTVLFEGTGLEACRIAWIEADGFEPRIAFWDPNEIPYRSLPGAGLDESLGGWIDMTRDEGEQGRMTAADDLLFEPSPGVEPDGGACAIGDETSRVDWSASSRHSDGQLVAVTPSPDGCLEIDWMNPDTEQPLNPMYVCVPRELFVFEPGDSLRLELQENQLALSSLVDGQTIELRAFRHFVPGRDYAGFGIEVEATAQDHCDLVVEPVCSSVTRAMRVSWGEGAAVASAGELLSFTGVGGIEASVFVGAAREVLAIDHDCAAEGSGLGPDLSLAVLTRN